MEVTLWKIDQVKPYENNPRDNDDAVGPVAKSIQEFGWRQPIVVDGDGVIIVGHTRWRAAKKLKLTEVPVHVATDLSADQIRAYRLADNQTGTLSCWDNEKLVTELFALTDVGFDLSMIGFGSDELDRVMHSQSADGLSDADEIPAPPDEATTKPGDLWILGDHRLLCGDSSKESDLDRLLGAEAIHLVNTDPPYNVKVEPRSQNAIAAGLSSFTHQKSSTTQSTDAEKSPRKKLRAKDRPLANDFVGEVEFEQMLHAWFGNASRVLQPGRSFYIWGGYANVGNYPPVLKATGLYFSQAIIWNKLHPVLTRKDFMGAHEWCFYGWKLGASHEFFGPNNVPDLWEIKKVNPQAMVHLTEKPADLAARAMQYSSRPGENVLDLFGGSGSTLIAAEQTGRKAFLMELDPLYCDVIVQRYEKFTGKKAELATG